MIRIMIRIKQRTVDIVHHIIPYLAFTFYAFTTKLSYFALMPVIGVTFMIFESL